MWQSVILLADLLFASGMLLFICLLLHMFEQNYVV